MIRYLMSAISSGNWSQFFAQLAAMLFVMFVTMPVHEAAHAYVAVKQGDPTPKLAGRLTLNPMAHLDLIGSLMILLVGFGYAKPVECNINNMKNGRKSFALVALAGPCSNLLMAVIFMLFANLVNLSSSVVAQIFYIFFYMAANINVSLAVFNLIPIPPLDGSRILTLILPQKAYYILMRYERIIMLVLLVLIWIGLLDKPLAFLSKWVMFAINFVTGLPFRFIG